ncbi:MAG: DUF2586 domain-containing protein [Bacteroides sp.]|nr:DUF2586 domain-containing protein [Bacteroides sp.]
MLPGVRIKYANGALGQVEAMADGCLGFIALGAVAEGDFQLGTDYMVKNLAALEELGVTAEKNPLLYRNVKDFFNEAGDGSELWLMGFPDTATFKSVFDKDNASGAKALLLAANGKLRALVGFKSPAATYEPTIGDALDEDVREGMVAAQLLGEWITDNRYAPIFTLLEGYAYTDEPTKLLNLTTCEYNRVGIVIGDTVPDSPNACMGIVAGRIAASAVQHSLGRVRSGALTPLVIYVGSKKAELADVETIHEKGYITFTTYVGKTGYFIADDPLATKIGDDYRSIPNRRVIDKAFRIVYNASLDVVSDDIPVADGGTLAPAWCAALEAEIETDLITQMTNNGNLGNDPQNQSDTAVKVTIDHNQNIYTDETLRIKYRVKPRGYTKYIDGELGFSTSTN